MVLTGVCGCSCLHVRGRSQECGKVSPSLSPSHRVDGVLSGLHEGRSRIVKISVRTQHLSNFNTVKGTHKEDRDISAGISIAKIRELFFKASRFILGAKSNGATQFV